MTHKTKRYFLPGEEWLYYKIYCGVNTADIVLTDYVQPFVAYLIEKKIITKWFFIRYSEHGNHLRIRFLLKNVNQIHVVMQLFQQKIEPLAATHQIWDVQINTYVREIERYGATTIEEAESFFYKDSDWVLRLISEFDSDTNRFEKTILYAQNLIASFKLSVEEEINFLHRMSLYFKNEFDTTKRSNKRINIKYNEIKSSLLVNNSTIIDTSSKEIIQKLITKKSTIPNENLLASLIHMNSNRVFKTSQRLYEMLIYNFLYKASITTLKRNEQ
ncbi:thiopeptide-type bacteriocin biosynthesis protein [Tenacibaculum amylolyticum]|uniref:thiopeptide-type bacteriocin biosynthesis protein n=1 Tax=Tenacibaculum amylolyticum TaxID=104269 RepID=UPI0038942B8B